MEKLLAMHVAAQLTGAACANVGGPLPVSADLSDNNVRAKNLQVWETFRVFYRGVTAALADTQSWPSPKIDAGALVPNLIQSALPALGPLLNAGPIGDIVKKLLAALPAPAPSVTGPLPDPGASK